MKTPLKNREKHKDSQLNGESRMQQQSKEEYLVSRRSKTRSFFKVTFKWPFLLPHSILKQLGGGQKLTYLRKSADGSPQR